jgi:hypothetical protein
MKWLRVPQRWQDHPVYGRIPLIREGGRGLDGKEHEWWRPDPAFRPRLPRGAVRGDVAKQDYCAAHWDPKYFYLDEARACVQCRRSFVFRAAEQKFWYETLKFNFSSIPIRCPACRRQRRSDRALHEQIARSKIQAREQPENPTAHLSVARAIVEAHERTGQGNLDEAIAAARRAARLLPHASESLFWEGVAHALAGRTGRARESLRRFIDDDSSRRNYPMLVKKASARLGIS